jgi:ABC-type multidrug transport system fused ATPase/permease subunit
MSALISAIFVCAYYQPNSLLILPFLIYLGYKITKFYQKCARELTRMESIVRSPLINTLNETIPGLMSIRAYNLTNEYLNKWFYVSDENLKVKLILRGVSQWFDLALDLLSFIFVVFLVIFTFLFKEKFSPKIIGLLLTYCFSLQRNLTRGLKQTTTLETSMICFERCLEYTKIQSEASKKLNIDNTLKNWPKEGKIEFINFSTKYRPDTEIVLSNLNFLIEPNKKIGICGRTGSGKSTITLCLFRILESITGKILIDDIDISKIGLDKLRSSLTIIPQDPCLFQGTLKYNIDPLNKYSNEEILNVFQKIGFDYIINKNPKGFNMEVAEGGTNLSVGEKQLICISRAILRKTKIIIMDEATANIDYETESIIQKAIGEIMNDATIITIAHRIKTIIKYDKILVLDKGVLMDFDSPEELLKKKEGIFYELYNKSH